MRTSSLLLVALTLASCDAPPAAAPSETFRPRSTPVEYVGLTVERPFADEAELLAILDPIFGEAARTGAGHRDLALEPGLFLTVSPDGRTPEQAIVTMEMETVREDAVGRRIILEVPVSFTYGGVFISAARAALERATAVLAAGDAMRPYHLEYHVVSPMGGELTVQTDWAAGASSGVVRFITAAPRTSLVAGLVNTPAFGGAPYEQLGGTVWFELSLDEFSFFSNRAYGISSGALQNFNDFRLQPHDWLRLTVTPRLEDEMVDVGFEVITPEGARVPFARAPASVVAGEQFQENVGRMVQNMLDAEAAEAGSARPFEVSFYYDDPEGGGVVSVIAQGRAGIFQIAYTVASPSRPLEDVAFVPYQGAVDIPDTLPTPRTCAEVGSVDATSGRFHVRFDASTTVRNSAALTSPLMGNVWGSVYRSTDVTIVGPNEGAEPVASFAFEAVDVREGLSPTTYDIPELLAGGEYQILGFMDIDGNADPASPDPDEGDPVFIPIGGYDLRCADEPITVEAALLLPPGR
jgi:hypothetical protein